MKSRLLLAIAGLLALVAAGQAQTLVFKNVERKINLKSQIAKVSDTIEVSASGGTAKSLLLCWPERLAARMSRLRAGVGKERFDPKPADAPAGVPAGVRCYSAEIEVPKGQTVTVEASAAFTGVLAPNPAKVAQDEQQHMEYEDTLWAVSPYKVEQQTTTVTLPTSTLLSHSSPSKATVSGAKVTYQKLGAAGPWSLEPLKLHFHHDKAFKKVVKLVREIEVSHWGNIYVEESYLIANGGAEHKGPFSRLRHSYSMGSRGNSFQNIKARLPPSAHSLYYKDLIGNISSSNTRKSAKETLVDINLRYPLLGGWKTDFVLGYSLPLDGFLFHRPKGRSRLIVDLSSPIDDVVIEDLETRVVLPEGSANIKYTLPFDVDEVAWDKKFTYLDTAGRPVLVLRKHNLTPQHNRPFAVDYTFGTGALLREPLLLITVFAAFFAAVALYNRLELTISKDDRWLEARVKERAAATLQKLAALWDDEADQIKAIAETADKLADTEGIEAAGVLRHAAERRLKELDAQAKPLIEALEAESAKAAAQARDHAERGKALQAKAAKLLADKADHLRKGVGAAEASKRVAAAARAVQEAHQEWTDATAALVD